MLKNLSALNQRITLAAWKVVSRKWFAEKEKGQTLSEYGVIIGVVVGVVVVAVVICVPRTNRGRLPGRHECSEFGALIL